MEKATGSRGSRRSSEGRRRRSWRRLGFRILIQTLLVLLSVALIAIRESAQSPVESWVTDTTVALETRPTVELDWSSDRSGRYPDPSYRIGVHYFWFGTDLYFNVRLSAQANSQLESLSCADRSDIPMTGRETMSEFERVYTFDIGQTEPVDVACTAVLNGEAYAFGVEWPQLFRLSTGEFDGARSDLSGCLTQGASQHPTTPADLDDEWSLRCDRKRSRSWLSEGDYWLDPDDISIWN